MIKNVHLDSALWYELAEGSPCKKFESAICRSIIVPVLSVVHLIEFARSIRRTELLNFIEKINCIRRVQWIKPPYVLAKEELRNAYYRYCGMEARYTEPLTTRFRNILQSEWSPVPLPGNFEPTITQLIESMAAHPRREALESYRRQRLLPKLSKSVKRQTKKPIHQSEEFLRIADEMLPITTKRLDALSMNCGGPLCTPAGVQLHITPDSRAEFFKQLKWEDCPTIYYQIAYRDGCRMNPSRVRSSDFDDAYHVSAIGYCDVVFADRGTCDAIKRGGGLLEQGSTHELLRNGEFHNWLDRL